MRNACYLDLKGVQVALGFLFAKTMRNRVTHIIILQLRSLSHGLDSYRMRSHELRTILQLRYNILALRAKIVI